ncbi:MAG TPA: poly-gamma-glutamate hydrolase family protein [Actinomycetota bacterium]|jgi:phage replication-related protein YjqB (UPF0714/DUF867 family)|nr:poly-gamma-glutamate hydrolase family protein [Actinomycetota bacterium]
MTFASNTALYADTRLTEGVDWARRFRRHELFDDSLAFTGEVTQTAIIAPHGGGIEPGTSELCLAVAGYHPAMLPETPPAGVTYDYWMFEGLRPDRNDELHVTSTGCDDEIALSLCGGALRALSLHGFKLGPGEEHEVLVGGAADETTRLAVRDALVGAGFKAILPGAGDGEIDGNKHCNIVNRTRLGAGIQLELSLPLRQSMFGEFTRARRKHTTNQVFWTFVAVCRDVIERLEAERVTPPPCEEPQPTLTTS